MTSMAFSAENLFPISSQELRPAAHPAGRRTVFWPLRAIAEVAGSILFLGVLGWEVWRIASQLFQPVIQMAAGATCSEPVVHAAESVWPASGAWPWW